MNPDIKVDSFVYIVVDLTLLLDHFDSVCLLVCKFFRPVLIIINILFKIENSQASNSTIRTICSTNEQKNRNKNFPTTIIDFVD